MAGPQDIKTYMEEFRKASWDALAEAAAYKSESEKATAAQVEISRRVAQAQVRTATATVILAVAMIILGVATSFLFVATTILVLWARGWL